jgi:hypothetical protein
MAFGVYEDVLWFQVPICDTFFLMQKFKDEYYLGGVELRGGFVEATCAPEITEDFAPWTVVELYTRSVPDFDLMVGVVEMFTSMYNESWSWKLETKVVIKGCPATPARTFRSLRTCSTCLRRITVKSVSH